VERNCYRCGGPIDDRSVFCPACGAAQIRVSSPGEARDRAEHAPDDPLQAAGRPFAVAAGDGGIRWDLFVKTALPLSAVTGVITWLLFPAILLVLPLMFRSTLGRYRRFHPGALSSGQGARLGALMALLSFAVFAVFFVPTAWWNRDYLVTKLQQVAAQSPDLQVQHSMLWFTGGAGLIACLGLMLVFALIIFILIGLLSGALMTGAPKNRS
jgi:hypothetical protein